ncbi:hypothetical protein BLL37_24160 [Pseudomonas azotoformans]|uniref:Uncharacterized protein n=1 Tax=Pseudomonas azotoformans TaxID=47878 RepID=A0A1V2JAH4_PSEAZ|nr:hypothetical protein BFL39_01925 [Pseudomonas azotoformans]ONH42265.1 hypothetical protein BLL37_24160 [Pseudomonas azotoformans]
MLKKLKNRILFKSRLQRFRLQFRLSNEAFRQATQIDFHIYILTLLIFRIVWRQRIDYKNCD